jgi:hypothetical protein
MLGALMLDGVGGEVYHADIVIVDQGYLGFGGGGALAPDAADRASTPLPHCWSRRGTPP